MTYTITFVTVDKNNDFADIHRFVLFYDFFYIYILYIYKLILKTINRKGFVTKNL